MTPLGKGGNSWAVAVKDEILSKYPNQEIYVTAAGISPSGVVHFGNFRDVATAHVVREELRNAGKRTRLIFSWDNFDRFRKVPVGIPQSYAEHIGKPLSRIPDPLGELSSYAERFELPFMEAMKKLDIEIEYRDQTKLYESGIYDKAIFEALSRRYDIAEVMLSFMSDKAKGEKGIDPAKYRENYYPISVYSRFTGKDNTKVINYDGVSTIKYVCRDTGKEDKVDLSREHIAKLAWKVDWPMRWKHEQVIFEPGGHDHASPGSSFDVGSVISKKIFDREPPLFVEYKFVGIQGLGAKMSGSKGNAISPLELLDVYEENLLKWLYFRKSPDQEFELAFNTEIYRQYDEFDREHNQEETVVPFRQAVGFGQVLQWQEDKVEKVLKATGAKYSLESIKRRLPLARNWLVRYNPEEMIVVNASVNKEYVEKMNDKNKGQVRKLVSELRDKKNASVKELEELVYAIPKSPELSEPELKKRQREFFKDVYNLLISSDVGPRLGTFLWAIDRKQAIKLLSI